MKGRGVRVVSETEMENVNPGVKRKTRFMVVDAVGVCERCKTETRPLEKKPTVSFEKLLDAAALGTTEVAAVESLAGRLIRLERRFDAEVAAEVVQTAKGQTLSQISKNLLSAIDPDEIQAEAKQGKGEYYQPTKKEITDVRETRIKQFVACYNPKNRHDRKESERFKAFTYDELIKRDKVNLDIFWLKDDALEESANLPAPEIIAQEITDDLEAALEQFATIAEDLKR